MKIVRTDPTTELFRPLTGEVRESIAQANGSPHQTGTTYLTLSDSERVYTFNGIVRVDVGEKVRMYQNADDHGEPGNNISSIHILDDDERVKMVYIDPSEKVEF